MLSSLSRSFFVLPLTIFLTYNNISYAIRDNSYINHVRIVHTDDDNYMHDFYSSLSFVLKNESGLVNNAQDRGGITNFGISLKLMKSLSDVDLIQCDINFKNRDDSKIIENLTLEQATLVYKKIFWDDAAYDKIHNEKVRTYIFDTSVNLGLKSSILCAQRAIKAINTKFQNFSGRLDRETLDNINKYDINLLPILRSERANYYKLIVARDQKQAIFLAGWLNRAYQ